MKSEKDKMLAGELYFSGDEVLVKERKAAKVICSEINSCNDEKRRNDLFRSLLGKAGEVFNIESSFYCDYGYNIEIGENFYSNHNLVILDCAKVKFGDNVLIGPNVGVYTAGHPLSVSVRNSGLEYAKPITVGNNVWIGGGVTINPGVSIGDNCVIGSGSVVTKDIPENSVAFGNPCKVVRQLSDDELR